MKAAISKPGFCSGHQETRDIRNILFLMRQEFIYLIFGFPTSSVKTSKLYWYTKSNRSLFKTAHAFYEERYINLF